jgi:AcrR family transcriptional regulator
METNDRIKQKAHDLVMQYGIRSVSMDDIAGALGMSKKTIYQYFSDKDELVEAVIADKLRQNQECCTQDKQRARNAVHEIFLAIEMMQEMFQEMNPAVMYDLEKFHPKAYRQFLDHKYQFLYQLLSDNIRWGMTDGLYRSDLNIDIIVKARLECMLLAFNQLLFPKSRYTLVEVETQLTEQFLYGLATLKGHKLISKHQQDRIKKQRNEKQQ